MKQVNIYRLRRSNQGTEGLLVAGEFNCRTLELPWKENIQNISCIPAGKYNVEIRISNKYGRVYWIKNVKKRSFILLHSGNTTSHTYGCVLLGLKAGKLGGQVAVLNSRVAVRQFVEFMEYESFTLNIHETF